MSDTIAVPARNLTAGTTYVDSDLISSGGSIRVIDLFSHKDGFVTLLVEIESRSGRQRRQLVSYHEDEDLPVSKGLRA